VGQFPAAPAGTYDLVGNVWEWTASDDEKGLAILKGGSWAETNPANLRSATRYTAAADYSAEDVGFRCAHSLEEWPDATGALASADEGARR
jgi:formylglycine-generating enzyme required for sulfatase activity